MMPAWERRARQDLGLREIPGKAHAPVILMWLTQLGAWWSNDEDPWCGVAMAAWMRDCHIPLPKHWYRAKAWLEWGVPLAQPVPGCVVVFGRDGGGHVGMVVGETADGRLRVIGGNQGNQVNERAFDRQRVLGYRWPPGQPIPDISGSKLAAGNAPASTSEA